MTRVIGIAGAAHCGSTVLNMMMGQLPGVIGAGETHWLVDRERLPAEMAWPCRTHGEACPTFTPELIGQIAEAAPGTWWEWIAVAAGAHTVISTDKRPAHFDAFGLPDLVVVLYREPRYWVPSWSMAHGVSMERAAQIWRNLYLRVLEWVDDKGLPSVKINWSAVRADPSSLQVVCRLLGLEFSPLMLDFHERPTCHVGGNRKTRPGGLQPELHDMAVPEFNDLMEIFE